MNKITLVENTEMYQKLLIKNCNIKQVNQDAKSMFDYYKNIYYNYYNDMDKYKKDKTYKKQSMALNFLLCELASFWSLKRRSYKRQTLLKESIRDCLECGIDIK